MAILVVTASADLALAVAAKRPAVGIAPDDLETLLQSGIAPAEVIVDVGPDQQAIERVMTILEQGAPTASVVVVGGGSAGSPVRRIARLAHVSRPFTVDRLLDALGEPDTQPTVRPVEATATTESLPPEPRTLEPPEPDGTPRHRASSKSTRAKPAKATSVNEAIETLLAQDDLYSVAEVSEVVAEIVGEAIDAASAILVLDEDGWHVTAGRGLRPVERRAVFSPTNWLARRIGIGEAAVIVNGTDIARQELSGLPHIHLNHWMATAPPGGQTIVIVAREDGPFSAEDAMYVRDLLAETMPMLRMAADLRTLARRLVPLAE